VLHELMKDNFICSACIALFLDVFLNSLRLMGCHVFL
jgi:hypothetical protein